MRCAGRDRLETLSQRQRPRVHDRFQMTQSKLTGGVVAPCIEASVACQRHHVTPAHCQRASGRKGGYRSRHRVEVHCRSAQRDVGIESPRMNRSAGVDRAEQKLARRDRADTLDVGQQLRCRQRDGGEVSANSRGVRTPHRNAIPRGDAEADPVSGGNGSQPVLRVDLHRVGARVRRTAVFRRSGRNPAAAVAPQPNTRPVSSSARVWSRPQSIEAMRYGS